MSLSFGLSLPVVREAKAAECRAPADAVRELKELAHIAQECFCVITLNTKYKIIDRHLVGLGILDACLVHPREIFRPAISDGAAAVVLAHNHPSGDSTPSREDINLTRRMIEAGRLLDIEVLDHVVIGRPETGPASGYTSLRESGMVAFSTP